MKKLIALSCVALMGMVFSTAHAQTVKRLKVKAPKKVATIDATAQAKPVKPDAADKFRLNGKDVMLEKRSIDVTPRMKAARKNQNVIIKERYPMGVVRIPK